MGVESWQRVRTSAVVARSSGSGRAGAIVSRACSLGCVLALMTTTTRCVESRRLSPGSFSSVDSVIDSTATLVLDESEAPIVGPYVSMDPLGGFLLADAGEREIRRCTVDGQLLWRTGQSSGLASAFSLPGQIVRRPDGTLLVLDAFGRISVWGADGRHHLRDLPGQLRPYYRVRVVNDSLYLVAGRLEATESDLLWLWNDHTGRLELSFFRTPGSAAIRLVSRIAGMVDMRVRADTIAAVSSYSDTLYFFTLAGTPVRKVPIPFRGYQQLATAPRPGMSPGEQQRWMGSFSRILSLFELPDGGFLVQYAQDSAGLTRNHLLGMTGDGQWRFEPPTARACSYSTERPGTSRVSSRAGQTSGWSAASGTAHHEPASLGDGGDDRTGGVFRAPPTGGAQPDRARCRGSPGAAVRLGGHHARVAASGG